MSTLEPFYYSPASIEVSVEGRYEPAIAWNVAGKPYSSDSNPQLTPSVKTAWSESDRSKVFQLAFSMDQFPVTMEPFTVSGTVSLGDASTATFTFGPFKIFKRGRRLFDEMFPH